MGVHLEIEKHIPAKPFVDLINDELRRYEDALPGEDEMGGGSYTPVQRLAARTGMNERILWRHRHSLVSTSRDGVKKDYPTTTFPMGPVLEALHNWGIPFEHLYPEHVLLESAELDEMPSAKNNGGRKPGTRGRKPKLDDETLLVLNRLHIERGYSQRALGAMVWESRGFKNTQAAASAVGQGFIRLGLPRRERIEATVKASTKHGLSRRGDGRKNDESRAFKREQRRESGYVQDVRCEGIRTQYPRKGERCQRPALKGEVYCRNHHPDYREDVEAVVRKARESRETTVR